MRLIATMTAVVAVALTCLPASAQTDSEPTLQGCAAMTPDTDRLACYDKYAKATVSTVSTVETATQSNWQVSVETSPVDDSKNVFLYVTGENGLTNPYGQRSNLSLMVACRENTTALYFSFGGYFMSDLNGLDQVTFRIDDDKAQTRTMDISNDNEALGYWSGTKAIPMLKSMFGAKRIYVEATPYNDSSVHDFLPIAGLEEAIKPLRESCGW